MRDTVQAFFRARSRPIAAFSAFLVGLLTFSGIPAWQNPGTPKLIIVIVVDQMRADYLTRFQDLYSDSGFVRLARNGAYFANCNYDHVPTITAPGHSIVLSGIMPGTSGIISNEWYSLTKRQTVYCVEDSGVHGVGIDSMKPAGRMSPRNFHGSTVGDQLRAVSPSSKIIGIAVKDRSAILLAGQHPTGAYWFDADDGNWITSTYYCNVLPDWVRQFNRHHAAAGYFGKEWTKLLPDSAYIRSGKDSARGEGIIPGESKPLFPHRVNDLEAPAFSKQLKPGRHRFDALLHTPFGNEMTFDFARVAATKEELGMRGVTDLLAISLSPTDYCGHTFGPDSYEVEDMYLRLDRQIASFCRWVDSTWGLDNVIIAITSDHGVAPLPEQSAATHGKRVNPDRFAAGVKQAVAAEFGYDENRERLILAFSNDYFYLDSARIRTRGISLNEFEQAVRAAAMENADIAACYMRDSLDRRAGNKGSNDHYLAMIRNGFDPALSGQLAVVLKQFCLFSSGTSGTSHGTGYPYDTHVPLLISGPGIRSTTIEDPCTPNDLAPTLCARLGISAPPTSTGRVLKEVLK